MISFQPFQAAPADHMHWHSTRAYSLSLETIERKKESGGILPLKSFHPLMERGWKPWKLFTSSTGDRFAQASHVCRLPILRSSGRRGRMQAQPTDTRRHDPRTNSMAPAHRNVASRRSWAVVRGVRPEVSCARARSSGSQATKARSAPESHTQEAPHGR